MNQEMNYPRLWGDAPAADSLQPHTIEPHYFEL